MPKKFNIQTEDGEIVFAGIGSGNVYLTAYGKYVRGGQPIANLLVDEFTFKEYALSGQKKTVYVIVRVE
jgi:hypothetical protein